MYWYAIKYVGKCLALYSMGDRPTLQLANAVLRWAFDLFCIGVSSDLRWSV